MKYSFSLLDKAIEKWIANAYSQSPNKKYAVEYLYKKFISSNIIYRENANKGILKIADRCYHLYSLGKYKEVQSMFINEHSLCIHFKKEELEEYLNMKLIVNENILEKKEIGQFTPPPIYKIIEDKFKMEIYKACKDIIISKELLRKVKELSEYKIEEVVTTIPIQPKVKKEDTPKTTSHVKDVENKSLDGVKNVFCIEMPLIVPITHFQIFNSSYSKNENKPFLSKEQLDLFIRKAFKGEKGIEKIKFNQAAKGEKLLIQEVFYDFYLKYSLEYFGTTQIQEVFINLLSENFSGWNSKSLEKKFKPDIKTKLKNEYIINLNNQF